MLWQIERRLDMLEKMIARANVKDLPSLNATFQKLLDEQVRRDLASRQFIDDECCDDDMRSSGQLNEYPE